ncbi:hypothetical protein OF83DRAFT_1173226 [Amylostereum chailletii]|nr:hypothetical protein OF83DRAFT_1173226 [Amylostereum chailletii]
MSPRTPDKQEEYGAPFDDADADVVLRSSDDVNFRVYKVILTKASPFFKELLALRQPEALPSPGADKDSDCGETYDGLPLIPFSETKTTLSLILTLCYPIPPPSPPTLEGIVLLLAAAQKYELARVHVWAVGLFAASPEARDSPAKAFGMACSHRLEQEARLAARMALHGPLNLDALEEQLPFMDGLTLQRLMRYHRQCANVAVDLTTPELFTWIGRRDDQVWEWASATSCNCTRRKYLVANNETWNCKVWWAEYMKRAGAVLRVIPAGETVRKSELIRPSYNSEEICHKDCRPNVISWLNTFSEVFAAKVDQRTSQTYLFDRFDW